MKHDYDSQGYWKDTLKLLRNVLILWFLVSYGAGILFVDFFNQFHLGGYPLGFWFAHQGSIYFFVAQIFYYAWRMNNLDVKYDVHED